VAVDGYAGSGKTTVVDFIAKQNPDVLAIYLDDFVHHWKDKKRMIDEAKNKPRVFEYKWYRYDDLEKPIKEFKTKNKGTIKIKTYNYDKNDFGVPKPFDLSKKSWSLRVTFCSIPCTKLANYGIKPSTLMLILPKPTKEGFAERKRDGGKNMFPKAIPTTGQNTTKNPFAHM